MLSAQLVPLVARAVALEPSRPLLEHAPEGVEPVLGEAEQMPFQDSSFELVTIVNSLHHVADMRAVLAEMVRVVTPGGRIVVQDYLADENPERAEMWERVERLRDPDHRRLPRPGEVSELLAEHGFGEDESQTWTASWSLDDWLEMAATAVRGGGGDPPAGGVGPVRADRLAGSLHRALRAGERAAGREYCGWHSPPVCTARACARITRCRSRRSPTCWSSRTRWCGSM